jgi:hypothetical protein
MMVLKFSMVKSRYQAVVPRYMFLYEIREMSLFKKKKKTQCIVEVTSDEGNNDQR